MTGLEISVVITTVISPLIVACPLSTLPIVAHGGFDVIVTGSVVRPVLVVTAYTPSLHTEPWILLMLMLVLRRLLGHNVAPGVREEVRLVIVMLLLRPGLLQLGCSDWWLGLRLRLLGEVQIWDGHNVVRSAPSF